MTLLEKLLMQHPTVLYSHVLRFYVIDLTPAFYVHFNIFKKLK